MKKKRFNNPHIVDVKRTLWDFFLWKMGFYHDEFAHKKPPANFSYPIEDKKIDEDKPKVLWIGHSTFLIQYEDVTLLTDPIWSYKCSPTSIIGPKRRHAPPMAISDLPPIDFVLISHNHYDHMDKKSILELKQHFPNITWIVPKGVQKWFTKMNIENAYELDWWEKMEFQKERNSVTITACPAQHFSGRSLFDLNQTLWNGYITTLEGKSDKKTLYFTGDTGYNTVDFREIGARWPQIDLSLIPIGTYSPREFMQAVHISPYEAVKIHQDIGSRLSLGMHWKTFHLSDEPLNLPPYDLFLAMQKAGLPHHQFLPVEPGIYLNW